MSKSLGNTISAKHFYQKHGSNILRHLFLSSNFYQEIDINSNLIKQSSNYDQKIINLIKRLSFFLYSKKIVFSGISAKLSLHKKTILEALLNNLNTGKCLYFLDEIVISLNKMVDEVEKEKAIICPEKLLLAVDNFLFTLNILGLNYKLINYDFSTRLLIEK